MSVRKYDGTEHRNWRARLAKQEGSLLILDAIFETDIDHNLLGKIARGTVSTEYYWLDRWYNVFKFCDPGGSLRNYYCNINMPPHFDGRTLSYIDLDIDVLVAPDFSHEILDLDDFKTNSKHYGYSNSVQVDAMRGLDAVVRLIKSREFPFDQ